jgi:hypothetical protein
VSPDQPTRREQDPPRPEREDGSQRQGGTGQRQDNRAAPPGHEMPTGPSEEDGEDEQGGGVTPGEPQKSGA